MGAIFKKNPLLSINVIYFISKYNPSLLLIMLKRVLSTAYRQNNIIKRAASTNKDSFVTGLFQHELVLDQIFPFPDVLNEEQKENLSVLVDSSEAFFEDHDAAKYDKLGHFPKEVYDMIGEAGMMGSQVPEKYGGFNLTATESARLSEILISNDPGLSVTVGAHQSIGYKAIVLLGNEAQKDKYLPDLASGKKLAAFALTEPGTGSDASSVSCRAE